MNKNQIGIIKSWEIVSKIFLNIINTFNEKIES